MDLSREDVLAFKNFVQSITEKPRPIEAQVHVRQGIYLWCDDWEIIEICKYFFNGKDGYIGDSPPNRLKNNPLWSKEAIMSKADALWNTYGTSDLIINALRARRATHA